MIQNDLITKLKAKEEECKKHMDLINNFFKDNKNKINNKFDLDNEIKVSVEKYQQLLNLYSAEQDKNYEIENSYINLLNQFGDYIKDGKKINVDYKLDNNDSEMNDINNNKLNNNNNINNDDISFENYKKNKTYNFLKVHEKEDFIGMLNNNNNTKKIDTEINSEKNNNINIQDILNQNANLEENETLLVTQLQSIKEELKETREQVNVLVKENTVLKQELDNKTSMKKEEIIGPLRSALERLIWEIKLNNKVKEILTVILRLVCYTEEQIAIIYQYKEKKKNFFNMFQLNDEEENEFNQQPNNDFV